MKKILSKIVLFAFVASAVACQSDDTKEQMPIQFVPKGEIKIDPAYEDLSYTGNNESQYIEFTANDDWRLISTRDWVTIEPQQGSAGVQRVKISVDKNPTDEPRYAGLTFVIEHLRQPANLSQAKGNIIVTADGKSSYEYEKEATELDLVVTHNFDYTIHFEDENGIVDPEWISYENVEAGRALSGTSYRVKLTANDGYIPRTARMMFTNEELAASEMITFTQKETESITIPEYSHSVTSDSQAVSYEYYSLLPFTATSDNPAFIYVKDQNFDEATQRFKIDLTLYANTDTEEKRTGSVLLYNEEYDLSHEIVFTQDEYNVNGNILLTASGELATALSALENKSTCTKLIINGAALNATDFTALKNSLPTMPKLVRVDISKSATTEIPASIFLGNATLQEFIFPNTLETIGESAFFNCALKSVTIPASVKNWGKLSFSASQKITKVVLEEGLTVVGDRAFNISNSIVDVYIPSTIEKWEIDPDSGLNKAFTNSKGVKNLHLADGLKSIGIQSFYGIGAEEVTIPASVEWETTSAGINLSFGECASLKKITFKDGFKGIKGNPFGQCKGVEVVISESSTPPSLESNSISAAVGDNVSGGTKVYVPDADVEIYSSSTNWKPYTICPMSTLK